MPTNELRRDGNTFIIAEIGINHSGNEQTALQLIEAAASAGADAVKFQTYLTDKRVSRDSELYPILSRCELPFAAFPRLKARSDELGIVFFSTPFDQESVDVLAEMGCTLFKVSSFDVSNRPLLLKISEAARMVIMSTGMAHLEEIGSAVNLVLSKDKQMALLHCISAYPTPEHEARLATIPRLQATFPECLVGHSDHTPGTTIPLYAVSAGARILEKHFRLDENHDCVDAPVSITTEQMRHLVAEVRKLETIMGEGTIDLRDVELPALQFKRSHS
jgi:sialic acid synthase SpsE